MAQVTFQGRTTWAYAEWEGSLFSISGNNITIKGAPGHVLDGQGHLWWDTLGGGGGVTKPKFFKANNLNDSVLDSINIQNAPSKPNSCPRTEPPFSYFGMTQHAILQAPGEGLHQVTNMQKRTSIVSTMSTTYW